MRVEKSIELRKAVYGKEIINNIHLIRMQSINHTNVFFQSSHIICLANYNRPVKYLMSLPNDVNNHRTPVTRGVNN